ncbi:DUF4136 domain-containing protein [Novilysobacter selenitireducens]|uniref:DUF4136 domain-containing protein n=1 Tax=Novilysobacter selenitireducens TaxID=2872639 RepID=A0ABS7T5F4_9GAMM|nr:DUF4136 domain-containing protein [Lysobacter selenitireducens]MBZ4039109.1 DUF4136 domain-containing protein [Lysobacter selenitireducens]
MKALAAAVLLAACLGACTTAPTVRTDFSPTADFSPYSTYSWAADPEGMAPLVRQRVQAAIDAQLQAKGWRSASEGGDVTLVARASTQQKQDVNTYYQQPMWGGWGWRGGWAYGPGIPTTMVRSYEEGTLVVDMLDTASKQAIWRGTASKAVPRSQEDLNAAIQAGVAKMFEGFPPG